MSTTSPTTQPSSQPATASPPNLLSQTLAFLLVGLAWGLTTPFIRRAALHFNPPPHAILSSPSLNPVRKRLYTWALRAWDLARFPAYWVPLAVNLSGSLWFFVLVGGNELSLTVPITNSLAFLFTVLGDWWAEGKVISRDTWIGMAFVLGGIALCVQSKNT